MLSRSVWFVNRRDFAASDPVPATIGLVVIRVQVRAGRRKGSSATGERTSSTGLWLPPLAIGHALHDIGVGMIR